MQSTQPQLNNNANNSNNNVAGPAPSQRRWVPPSRDRRTGGDGRNPHKGPQNSSIGKLMFMIYHIFYTTLTKKVDFHVCINICMCIEYGVGPRSLGGQHSPSSSGVTPNLSRGNNSNTVNDIPPNTTYSKFSASLAASHAQAVSSSGGNSKEADRELSRNDVAFRKVKLYF